MEPWVFAWAQTRANLPGWYGLGTALETFIEERGDAAEKTLPAQKIVHRGDIGRDDREKHGDAGQQHVHEFHEPVDHFAFGHVTRLR